jgi:hypothetical protein
MLALLLANPSPARAMSFLHGDAVPMMRRVQHNGSRTQWEELPLAALPRFGVDHTVVLDALPTHAIIDKDPYKFEFALNGLQFLTTWIAISDPTRGHFLERVEMRLTSSGDQLVGMQWHGEYYDVVEAETRVKPHMGLRQHDNEEFRRKAAKKHPHISVRFVWDSEDEHDATVALALLLVLCACLATWLLCATCTQHGAALELLWGDPEDDRIAAEASHQPSNARPRSDREAVMAAVHSRSRALDAPMNMKWD